MITAATAGEKQFMILTFEEGKAPRMVGTYSETQSHELVARMAYDAEVSDYVADTAADGSWQAKGNRIWVDGTKTLVRWLVVPMPELI